MINDKNEGEGSRGRFLHRFGWSGEVMMITILLGLGLVVILGMELDKPSIAKRVKGAV